MTFQLNQDLKFFNWNNVGGGGGGVSHLQHLYYLYFLCQKPLFCWVPFNKTKFKTKLNEFGNKQNSTFSNGTSIIV